MWTHTWMALMAVFGLARVGGSGTTTVTSLEDDGSGGVHDGGEGSEETSSSTDEPSPRVDSAVDSALDTGTAPTTPAPSCGLGAPDRFHYTLQMPVEGADRTAIVDVPDAYDGSEMVPQGGGHTWPGALPVPLLGETNQDIDATDELLNFFDRWARP